MGLFAGDGEMLEMRCVTPPSGMMQELEQWNNVFLRTSCCCSPDPDLRLPCHHVRQIIFCNETHNYCGLENRIRKDLIMSLSHHRNEPMAF